MDEEPDALLEFLRRALESGIAGIVSVAFECWIGDAPVDQTGMIWEVFGAMLSDSVAESDDVVEAHLEELAHVLCAPVAQIEAVLAHDSEGIRVQGLWSTPRAEDFDTAPDAVSE